MGMVKIKVYPLLFYARGERVNAEGSKGFSYVLKTVMGQYQHAELSDSFDSKRPLWSLKRNMQQRIDGLR